MALRKFKKLMVPLSVLFIAAMLVPIFLKIGESIRAGKNIQQNNEVIAEVNGHKIHRLDLERGVAGVKNKIMQIKSMKEKPTWYLMIRSSFIRQKMMKKQLRLSRGSIGKNFKKMKTGRKGFRYSPHFERIRR